MHHSILRMFHHFCNVFIPGIWIHALQTYVSIMFLYFFHSSILPLHTYPFPVFPYMMHSKTLEENFEHQSISKKSIYTKNKVWNVNLWLRYSSLVNIYNLNNCLQKINKSLTLQILIRP